MVSVAEENGVVDDAETIEKVGSSAEEEVDAKVENGTSSADEDKKDEEVYYNT